MWLKEPSTFPNDRSCTTVHLPDPTFPPLLTGHSVKAPVPAWDAALKSARAGDGGAGDIYWARNVNHMEFALILEPEVSRGRCPEMLYLGMVAFSDALGSIAPPEVAVTFLWPNIILVNGAVVGTANLQISDAANAEIPDWMVFGMKVAIKPQSGAAEPGEHLDTTCLHLEGCGDLDRTRLTESTTRHLVNWIYTWSEDGFKPVHLEWTGRYHRESKMGALQEAVKSREPLAGTWIMLDEWGNAIVQKAAGESASVHPLDALYTPDG